MSLAGAPHLPYRKITHELRIEGAPSPRGAIDTAVASGKIGLAADSGFIIDEKVYAKSMTSDGTEGLYLLEMSDIKVGDQVLSRNEVTGEIAYRAVKTVFEHGSREIYLVAYHTILGVIDHDGLPIYVTEEHPFWINGKGWTPVIGLQPGDEMITHEGNPVVVRFVSKAGLSSSVLNFEVEEFHTYFVGDYGIWVHNYKNA